jgi:p24 family protein delta-1
MPAGALRFDLKSGHIKCIFDDIKVGAMAVGKYHIVAPDYGSLSSSQQLPDTHRISLRVSSPYGNSLHYSENVQSATSPSRPPRPVTTSPASGRPTTDRPPPSPSS